MYSSQVKTCILSVAILMTKVLSSQQTGMSDGSFKELKRRIINPVMSPSIEGKTLQELGVVFPHQAKKRNVRGLAQTTPVTTLDVQPLQGKTVKFFSIYDEFGPDADYLGDAVGFNGLIYNHELFNLEGNQTLTSDDVIGSLKGHCTIAGTDDCYFCTYELLIATDVPPVDSDPNFGSVIATGSLDYRANEGGYLIVEATGADYSEFSGGVLAMRYLKLGEQGIFTGQLEFF